MAKSYKDSIELKQHLEIDRNVLFEKIEQDLFSKIRYNDVVDAYKDIIGEFKREKYVYPTGTTIRDFLYFNDLNVWLSSILYIYIGRYEDALKLFISNKVCESMTKAGSLDCCDYTLFKRSIDINDGIITSDGLDCFIDFNKTYVKKHPKSDYVDFGLADSGQIEARKKAFTKIINLGTGLDKSELNEYAKEYLKKNRGIPFYILIGSLSFSSLIIVFELLTKELQLEFLKTVVIKSEIKEIDILSFSKRNNIIRVIRNITHHHEPVIPFLVKKDWIFDFNTIKASIDMLAALYQNTEFSNNPSVLYNGDFEYLKRFESKKAKRLVKIIENIK